MAGIGLNKSFSLMLFQHKIYEPVHVIFGLSLYLVYLFYKSNYFTGKKIVKSFTINYLKYKYFYSYKIIK